MATHAVERLSASAKEKTGIQVLLSTIYASAGKWSDFANVRKHTKEKGVLKVPGLSSTDVNGVIHESTSGEESHPEKDIDKQERILAEPTQRETSHCLRVCMFRSWNACTGC
ncbi:unnamed protein product [Fraxinus pennsylvanica]|uniref:Uncharacterized protein n=1 Tax=Fraxinus pennsylvanica TaxID=56036 RepID=A0AAD1Z6K2_9LAMI|nr:unnamed protein product [Fraxinus pennsylvanica]